MANVTTRVTATGSYLITIDNDNDSVSQSFRVRSGISPGGIAFEVFEAGNIVMTNGNFERTGAIVFDNTDTSLPNDPIIQFINGGTFIGSVRKDGMYDVENGVGVRAPHLTSDPNGSRSGTRGEIVEWVSGGSQYLPVNTTSGAGSGTGWKKFLCSI